ncbi:MAG TPA: ATP-dependent helicase [Propionicimonas sp.]|nr:ATP-dependent helicase [Propionicimonas sp.]
MDADGLNRFSTSTQQWFAAELGTPTPAQVGAWSAIAAGEHTVVVAPTGSGKTLAAFLWALDQLITAPASNEKRCRVLYISPLKALAVDVERNLQRPLEGITRLAAAAGETVADVQIAVRTGDTSSQDRQRFARRGADILITTPESLFLLLTSAAREALRGVETVIVDEVHALAGTKRGAHLALSLERLDDLLEHPAQRVGLSATVRPHAEVARYLAGGRPTQVVNPPAAKTWDLSVVVPVADLGDVAASAPPGGSEPSPSIWPHVEERIVDAIAEHHSTLVFVNSRRLAERLTARLNEIWLTRHPSPATSLHAGHVATGAPVATWSTGSEEGPGVRTPAEVMAQSAMGHGAPAVLARAHHGSVSREQRQQIEAELKAGSLPAVVATSSLELGIDMGAIDLVIQVESPPSVASGLQRVGRAGHQVGAVSQGVLFPKFRGDLVQTAVVVERMLAGQIEALQIPSNPLDVLAQQIVAMVAMDDLSVDQVAATVSRAAPFAALTRPVLVSVLDMLAGRYPSEEFAELRPRLDWDRSTDLLTARRSAQRLAVTSGGTIPDRGLYGVFLAGEGDGRRVGELDEEMVYESRVGDVIALGTSSWRIEQITHDQVVVSPAPGQPARLPFWKGDALGRPAELGRAVGAFMRELSEAAPEQAHQRLAELGLDDWARANLLGYLFDQRQATGSLPHDRQLVIERFRDELGDWRVVVHSPFGARVHAPWALLAAARLRERFGVLVQAMHADDGMIFRLPDTDWTAASPGTPPAVAELAELIFADPEEVSAAVNAEVGGSALFASRFRECAGRALLLPNRRPGKRQALWQQRLRSSALLSVASQYPEFPIVLEAVRECVTEVFDVAALVEVLREVRDRRITTVTVDTERPSPFAASLQFGYVAQYLYDDDAPLAERRAAALSLDPELLAQLLGRGEGPAMAELLDPEALTQTENELQQLTAERAARDCEDVDDLLRVLGPLTTAEVARRCREPKSAVELLRDLAERQRVVALPDGRWSVVEDIARLEAVLGVPVPDWVPQTLRQPSADPLGDFLIRYARTHTVFDASEAAGWLGLGVAVVVPGLNRLVAAGRLTEGAFRPDGWVGPGSRRSVPEGTQFAEPDMLRLLRRRSLAVLRRGIAPVEQRCFARFLPEWQGLGRGRGIDGVLRAVEQLAGVPIPASALETLVLPGRVVDYSAAMLDELATSGEVLWQGHGALGANDGWISVHPAATAALTLASPTTPGEDGAALLAAIGPGGHFFRELVNAAALPEAALVETLWSLVWTGQLTNDSFAALRARLSHGASAHPVRPRPGRARYRPSLSSAAVARSLLPPDAVGRWSVLPAVEADATARAVARSELLVDRYGIVTRGSVAAEELGGGFAGLYPVLAAAETAGRLRRGYFVEGLGAAQFGSTGAIDRLRSIGAEHAGVLVLAATDPASPFGAALPWPPRTGGHQPARKAGAVVVIVDGELVLWVERGGHTLLSWSEDPAAVTPAAAALAEVLSSGALGRLTLTKLDGEPALTRRGPLVDALTGAGFGLTPKGLRLPR